MFFFFKQKTAYEIGQWLEFRRVLFRSQQNATCTAHDDTGIMDGSVDGLSTIIVLL